MKILCTLPLDQLLTHTCIELSKIISAISGDPGNYESCAAIPPVCLYHPSRDTGVLPSEQAVPNWFKGRHGVCSGLGVENGESPCASGHWVAKRNCLGFRVGVPISPQSHHLTLNPKS